MKKVTTILILFFLILMPLILAQEEVQQDNTNEIQGSSDSINIKEITKGASEAINKNNPWNEAKVISPVWQTLIGGLFGLNLHKESTEITVNEAIVFFMVFVMFFVIILDVLKITPLFKTKFFSGEIISGISGESIAAFVITIIVSITGAFINLKNLLISGVAFTVMSLNWQWLNNAVANKTFGAYFIGAIIFIAIIVIHEILSLLQPIFKKYSEVSRAEAKGRIIKTTIQKSNNN